jgi:hypothetical protein
VADCNAFEAMRYLSSHAADYGLASLAAHGVEPVLVLALPAPLLVARSGFSDLRMWGLPSDSDVSQELWTLLAMCEKKKQRKRRFFEAHPPFLRYLHVRGESDVSRLRMKVILVRTPVSTRAVVPSL